MEATIQVQEEFENLIEQLERLKSINELTSTNTGNANRVIAEVDAFIRSSQEYTETLEADMKLKSAKIEDLLSKLEASVQQMDNEAKKLSSHIGEAFSDYKNITKEEFHTNFLDVKEVFEDCVDRIGNLKFELNNAFIEQASSFRKTQDSNSLKISEKLETTRIEILEKITGINQQSTSQHKSLKESISILQDNFRKQEIKTEKGLKLQKYLLIATLSTIGVVGSILSLAALAYLL
ncbi:hypothetical protein [Rufibacter hautae]|uniref:Uncharacterized protein n=1 Tax=Rufibacter hautae TaxID=2595005 RepID=A0A5B6TCQ9_9BACT|nr:hypothetical protein [Rufibacter hautae]KAA3436731.1 hypothetical protein FOA19_20345 [Rufibacter hautae]